MPGIDLLTTLDSQPFRGDASAGSRFTRDQSGLPDSGFDEVLSDSLKNTADRRPANDPRDSRPDAASLDPAPKTRSAAEHAGKPQSRQPVDAATDNAPPQESPDKPVAAADSVEPTAEGGTNNSNESAAPKSEDEDTPISEVVPGAAPQQLVNALLAATVSSQPVPGNATASNSDSSQTNGLPSASVTAESIAALEEAPLTPPAGLLPALQTPVDSNNQDGPVPVQHVKSATASTTAVASPVTRTEPEHSSDVTDMTEVIASKSSQPQESNPASVTNSVQTKTSQAPPVRKAPADRELADQAPPEIEVPMEETAEETGSEVQFASSAKPGSIPINRGSETLVSVENDKPATEPVKPVAAAPVLPTAANEEHSAAKSQETAAQGESAAAAESGDRHSDLPSNSTRVDGNGNGETASNPVIHASTQHTLLPDIQNSPSPQDDGSLDVEDPQPAPSEVPQAASTSTEPHRTVAIKAAHTGKGGAQVDASHVVEQAAQGIQIAHRNGREMQVRLSPPELGALQIDISVRDGVISARLETQSAAAQQLLTDNLQQLKESLSQQGLTVDRLDVFMGQQSGGNLAREGDGQNAREQVPEQFGAWEQSSRESAAPKEQRGAWSVDRSMTRGPLKQLDVVV